MLSAALIVPSRVKHQGEFRSTLLHLRLEAEALLEDLESLPFEEAKKRFETLRGAYQRELEKTKPDIVLTRPRRERIQNRLDEIMKAGGYI
jgi:predicted DNA-binding protein (UPF0251 family)